MRNSSTRPLIVVVEIFWQYTAISSSIKFFQLQNRFSNSENTYACIGDAPCVRMVVEGSSLADAEALAKESAAIDSSRAHFFYNHWEFSTKWNLIIAPSDLVHSINGNKKKAPD